MSAKTIAPTSRRDRLVEVYSHRDCLAVNKFARLNGTQRARVRRLIESLVKKDRH